MNSLKPVKVVLVNDTSLFNPHFGCQLVGQTMREQLCRVNAELIAAFPIDFKPKFAQKFFRQADLVLINGEGSIHHGKNLHLLHLADEYPTALINCIFQDNGTQSSLKNLLYISTRESLSAEEIRKSGPDCDVVPDLLFASSMLRATPRTVSKIELGITDNVVNPLSGFSPKSLLVNDVLSNLARCQRICAGRFHAAVAACVMGIPFSTWDSNTWKTRGMMGDIGIEHLHFETQSQALAGVPDEFDPRITDYALRARQRIEQLFEGLVKLAHGKKST
ncbi:polysaccharide pyruvyl transferase family protein [Pirellulaceae bacterium]|jgi:hypothetical protein|nr:polysaccharide pyruvyl transferase family protein [Pirellulaceae bacterium]